ncbi:MAG TPA: hypothetical protein VK158_05425 [Acidobacteriota bacterium]|nr:hypothetical protein [Acidobacteriota bacterium]
MNPYKGHIFEIPLSSRRPLFQRVLVDAVEPKVAQVINHAYDQFFAKCDSLHQLGHAAREFSHAMSHRLPFVGCESVRDYHATSQGPDKMKQYLESFYTRTRSLWELTKSGEMDCVSHILAFLHEHGDKGWRAYHAFDPMDGGRKLRHMVASMENFGRRVIIDPTREYVMSHIPAERYHILDASEFAQLFYPAKIVSNR